jgi:hypothetical protein
MKAVRVASAAVGLVVTSCAATAQMASDQAAAIVVFPKLSVQAETDVVSDTIIGLGNISRTDPVDATCFYLDASPRCTNTLAPCTTSAQCGRGGLCIGAWRASDFHIRLTTLQPLTWRLSEGLGGLGKPVPLDGKNRRGPIDPNDPSGRTSQTNAATLVPPLPAPFRGVLKCVIVDRSNRPLARNLLVGNATITRIHPMTGDIDVEKYNAIGLRAQAGGDGDQVLTLGAGGEYEGCANTVIVDHFFDFASDPANASAKIFTEISLVPCSEDLRTGDVEATSTTAQYLVFNEFEQRFSTSSRVTCFAELDLSNLDTSQPIRSIFSVGTGGSLVGQTRIKGVQHGLMAVIRERHVDASGRERSAAANVHQQGHRATLDQLTLP